MSSLEIYTAQKGYLPVGLWVQAGQIGCPAAHRAKIPLIGSDVFKQSVSKKDVKTLSEKSKVHLKNFRSKVKPGPALSWQELRDEGRRF